MSDCLFNMRIGALFFQFTQNYKWRISVSKYWMMRGWRRFFPPVWIFELRFR